MADSDEVDAHIQSMKELIDEMDDGAGDGGEDEGAFAVGSEPSGAFEPGDGDDDDAYTATSSAGDTGAHFGRGYEYGDGSSDVDEDDDEVVQELSLFVSKNLGDDGLLYLLQFPLRPSWRPYEAAATPSEVRIKVPLAAAEPYTLAHARASSCRWLMMSFRGAYLSLAQTTKDRDRVRQGDRGRGALQC